MGDCNYFIAENEKNCFVKLTGYSSYIKCAAFKEFVDELIKNQSYEEIYIDLSETEYLDSTSLGILAKMAEYMLEKKNKKAVIYSVKPDINKLLESVGFQSVFDIDSADKITPQNYFLLEDKQVTKDKLSDILLDSHKSLMGMNDTNRKTFSDVIEILHKKISRNL